MVTAWYALQPEAYAMALQLAHEARSAHVEQSPPVQEGSGWHLPSYAQNCPAGHVTPAHGSGVQSSSVLGSQETLPPPPAAETAPVPPDPPVASMALGEFEQPGAIAGSMHASASPTTIKRARRTDEAWLDDERSFNPRRHDARFGARLA